MIRTKGNDVKVFKLTKELVCLCYGKTKVLFKTKENEEKIFNMFIAFVTTQGCNRCFKSFVLKDFILFYKEKEKINLTPMAMQTIA